ncbi:MAG: acetylglutamate kinase [Actinomycetota bacterium]|nr:acetylglutamate kinase [Actinomycetota bacterium]
MIELPTLVHQRTIAKARILLEALPYMREHMGTTVVIKYGGAAMESAPLARPFAEDIALLTSTGIHPVIVHGGGPQVTEMSNQLGIETRFVDGLRFTDDATLDVATMVLAGKLNTKVVSDLLAGGVRAVGLSGVDGGLLHARKQVEPDLGHVGEVVKVNPEVVATLMERNFVPVVASIAIDEVQGQAYNVNADVVAAELAVGLGADKLIFLNDVPGIVTPTGELLPELGASECADLVASGVADGGMIPKLESSVRALRSGVRRVHLIDGRVEHALVLELFTPEGVGTMITLDAPTSAAPEETTP